MDVLSKLVSFLGLSMDSFDSAELAALARGGGNLRVGTHHHQRSPDHGCPTNELNRFYQSHNAKLQSLLFESWRPELLAWQEGGGWAGAAARSIS